VDGLSVRSSIEQSFYPPFIVNVKRRLVEVKHELKGSTALSPRPKTEREKRDRLALDFYRATAHLDVDTVMNALTAFLGGYVAERFRPEDRVNVIQRMMNVTASQCGAANRIGLETGEPFRNGVKLDS
jgi:hypothetical protein